MLCWTALKIVMNVRPASAAFRARCLGVRLCLPCSPSWSRGLIAAGLDLRALVTVLGPCPSPCRCSSVDSVRGLSLCYSWSAVSFFAILWNYLASLHLLPLPLGSLLDFDFVLTPCMGEPNLTDTIAEVQLALERLRIAVDSQGRRDDSPWVVVAGPSPETLSASSAEALPSGCPSGSGGGFRPAEFRPDILRSFPPCPDHCLDLCARLSSASGFSASDRARRAWIAGNWAKAILGGRVPTPAPPVLDLRPSVYIVLRSDRIDCPARFSTFRAFRSAVGPLEGSTAICHSFASLSEARVYCIAAGKPFPQSR